jgi:Flp pilus assembly protein TadG
MRLVTNLIRRTEGSALLEFAIVLPLLVVFVVGIYDFSGAFNEKQKIEHAAQVAALVAGNQPTGDRDPGVSNPDSLQPVLAVVLNSLGGDGVLPLANQGTCQLPVGMSGVSNSGLVWTYTLSGCSNNPADVLMITIDRGVVSGTTPATISTSVTVSFPYHWRFNSAIQLLFPGASYAATTTMQETATVHNQM